MTLSANLDAPEATLDALMQSAVCPDVSCSLKRTCEESLISQEMGWRDGSLRIVMILASRLLWMGRYRLWLCTPSPNNKNKSFSHK